MVFQEPTGFFNPRWSIGRTLREILVHARGWKRRRSDERARELMRGVGLSESDLSRYPFEMSGGMIQRAALAGALAVDPELLLADEITSALDPEMGKAVLKLVRTIAAERRTAVLLVSHDLKLVAEVSEWVGVLYAGRIIEQGPPGEVLKRPRHRYTDLLVRALPNADRAGTRLPEIPQAPTPAPAEACPFIRRCPGALAACRRMPAWDAENRYRCHNPVEADGA
jgi:oligopeptide/dipeptide ABC transporter ATP-binding protein